MSPCRRPATHHAQLGGRAAVCRRRRGRTTGGAAASARRHGLARPPLWAIPLSKVRVIAKDTLGYTFQSYTFITLHRCIFEPSKCIFECTVSQRRAPQNQLQRAQVAPGPTSAGRLLALAWLGLTHRAHRDDWLRGEGVVAHGERDYRHTRHAGTRERRLWRLRRRGRERRPLRPPGLLARLLDRPLCRHLLQPREGGLSAARMDAGSQERTSGRRRGWRAAGGGSSDPYSWW